MLRYQHMDKSPLRVIKSPEKDARQQRREEMYHQIIKEELEQIEKDLLKDDLDEITKKEHVLRKKEIEKELNDNK